MARENSQKNIPSHRRSDLEWFSPEDLTVVGLDTKAGAEHPLYRARDRFVIDPDLVGNIADHGVLEPIVARRNGTAVEVVVGVRRTLHAREANKSLARAGEPRMQIPVILKKITDNAAMCTIAVENSGRLDDRPVEQARHAQRMLDKGNTLDQVATAFVVSVATLKQRLRLLDLDEAVLARVRDGALAPSAAVTVADLPREAQGAELARLEAAGQLTAAGATTAKRKRVAKATGKSARGATFPRPPAGVARRVVEAGRAKGLHELPKDFLLGVEWAFGMRDAAKIRGLPELLKSLAKKR